MNFKLGVKAIQNAKSLPPTLKKKHQEVVMLLKSISSLSDYFEGQFRVYIFFNSIVCTCKLITANVINF